MHGNRFSGLLLHITSLPGPYGIGDLGPAAYAFVDKLQEAGQCLWQVLPLGPTGYGDSPYQSFSTFAGNELLISPEILKREGWLDDADLAGLPGFPSERVDFGWVIDWKRPLLFKAAENFLSRADAKRGADYRAFREEQKEWLDDYALFMSIKEHFTALAVKAGVFGAMWANYWPKELSHARPAALDAWKRDNQRDIERRAALQYFFFRQLSALKAYANGKRIKIIGDIPIFVAYDSVDVWAHRQLFHLDEDGIPIEVAGVPPDYFSEDGQLWGNPLYAWEVHRESGYAWWISRVKSALSMYDIVRVDHFRGMEASYAIPYGEKTARVGKWRPGPGAEFFRALKSSLSGDLPIIAEDLGFITPEVHALRDEFGLPGMRILQFAFNASASDGKLSVDNSFLPHNYVPETVVYSGTHDNDTLRGWLEERASPAEIAFIDRYLGGRVEDRAAELISEALKSVARWALFPMQDLLGLGNEARMNVPSTLGGSNWAWRMADGAFSAERAAWLKDVSAFFNRNL
jgi:4-alpha-glucanotransferase